MPDSEIAVCVPVFKRTPKVEDLLESVEKTSLDQVYIADDGKNTADKERVYNRDWGFDLEIFDLEFDSGVGEKRHILAKKPEEEYLLFIDSDMKVPRNYEVLLKQIKDRPNIGGVCGMILEEGRIRSTSSDFYEEDGNIVRDIKERKEIQYVGGAPFVEFDLHPQVGVFRKECLMDYNWDPEYKIMREHIDFFLGHWQNTSWTFGLSPQVYFRHYPGGSEEYMYYRTSEDRVEDSDEYFCEKWGYEELVVETNEWIDTHGFLRQRYPLDRKLARLFQRFKKNSLVTKLWRMKKSILE
jgi:hypothetical protein